VVGELGRGGMGVVYEAEDPLLERRVALKLLAPALADCPAAAQRFVREARAAARLGHPNVVAVHEVGDHGGTPYLVMELVPGGSAQALLDARGRLGWREATRLAADACRGLAAAHAAGLIHRDLKPSNLMLGRDGAVKLADFGLAKALDQATLSPATDRQVLGTPHYMSPEQCRSEPLDARGDVYALGATYYALLTGAPPFTEGSALAVMFAQCARPLPDPRAACPDIPEPCAAVLSRAMAKEPSQRYPSAAALLADLEALLAGGAPASPAETLPRPRVAPPRLGRRAALAAGGAAVLSLLGGFVALDAARNSAARPSAKADPDGPAPDGLRADPADLPPFLEVGGPAAYRALAFARHRDLLACAVADEDGTVVLWDLAANRRRSFTAGHNRSLPSESFTLAISPNGQTLAHNRLDGPTLTTWDTASGERRRHRPLSDPFIPSIRELAFAPEPADNRTLALAVHLRNNPDAGNVVLRDTASGKTIARFHGPRPQASCVAFSPDGKLLAAGGDALVKVWDVASGRERFPGAFAVGAKIRSVSFSHDGRLLAAGGLEPPNKAVVKVWDVEAAGERPAPRGLLFGEALVAFSPAEPVLAACARRSVLWDAAAGEELASLNHKMRAEVRGLAFSGTGRVLALSGSDQRVHLFDVDAELGRARRDAR
jgi:WD40 repeat protein